MASFRANIFLRLTALALGMLLTLALGALLILSSSVARASAPEPYDPEHLNRAIIAVYERYFPTENAGPADPEFSRFDRETLIEALADEIAVLDPAHFNAVTLFVLRDYRQVPAHREGALALLKQLRSAAAEKLTAPRSTRDRAIQNVVHDVTMAFGTVMLLRTGQGLWAARGSGLSGLRLFRELVQNVVRGLPLTRTQALAVAGLGSTSGVIRALHSRYAETYLDPIVELQALQRGMVTEQDQKLAALRKTLRELSEREAPAPRSARNRPENVRALLRSAQAEAHAARQELTHLTESAPQERQRLQLVGSTLREVDSLLRALDAPSP